MTTAWRVSLLATGLFAVLWAQSGDGQDVSEQPVTEAAPAYQMHGVSFSPYVGTQDPNHRSQIPLSQIQARMKIIAPYTQWMRSFGMQDGLENIPAVARAFRKKMAAGAWLGRDTVENAREISNLIAAAQAGRVDIAIVGSEVLRRGDLSEAQLLGYMSQVRQAAPPGVKVTTAEVYGVLLAHPNVIAASDVVAANFYPFWEHVPIAKAVCLLRAQYAKIAAAAGGKQVIVSETGWPSDGNALDEAVPSPVNAARFFMEFVSWARTNNVAYWYFSALDEPWKGTYEGPPGPHWGIWDQNGVLKPGMKAVFNGQTVTIDCIACGPGSPSIGFTYIPPMGSGEYVEGQACHVDATQVNVVLYINVAGNWWVKPYANTPLTAVAADGAWSSAYVTGGIDETAAQFAAFLIPRGYSPPILLGQTSLPQTLYQSALSWTQAARSNHSITGRITNITGSPLLNPVVTLSGAAQGTAVAGPSGKYSFVNLAAPGTYAVTPALAGYTFEPPVRSVVLSGGNSTANFTGKTTIDLSASGRFAPTIAAPRSQSTDTLVVTNSGAGPASNVDATIALPAAVTLSSVSTNRGTCTAGTPIRCELGRLLPTQITTITLQLATAGIGRYAITTIVSSAEVDSNLKNSTIKQTLVVDHAPVPVSVAPAVSNSAHGAAVTFSATYADPDGASDLYALQLYAIDAAGAGLRLRYVVPKNQLYLLSDAGTEWLGGCTPGTTQVLSNSKGSLDCAATTVTPGNAVVVHWRVVPSGLSGANRLWLSVTDSQSVSSTKVLGSWTVTP